MYDIVCLEVYNRIAINTLIFNPIYYTKIQKMFNIDLLTNILKDSNKNVNKNLCQSTKIR